MQNDGTIFYVIHHPETEWNRRDIIQGHLDSPLTENGRAAAHAYGYELAAKGIRKIFSSDLGRCVETTTIVNEHIGMVPVVLCQELREQDYGILNGHSSKDIDARYDRSDPTNRPPEGESITDMSARILRFVGDISASETEPFLIVTHDGPFRAMQQSSLAQHAVLLDLPDVRRT